MLYIEGNFSTCLSRRLISVSIMLLILGSCIDGRLTSAWNWCNKLDKKVTLISLLYLWVVECISENAVIKNTIVILELEIIKIIFSPRLEEYVYRIYISYLLFLNANILFLVILDYKEKLFPSKIKKLVGIPIYLFFKFLILSNI